MPRIHHLVKNQVRRCLARFFSLPTKGPPAQHMAALRWVACLAVGERMKSFFRRFWPGAATAVAPEPPTSEPPPRRDVPPASSAEPAAMDALLAVGARRPLISSGGQVAGYEFRLADGLLQRLARRTDQQGQAAYLAALLASARLIAKTGRVGLARVPTDWIVHGAALEVVPNTWIALDRSATTEPSPALAATCTAAVAHLRSSGAKVGWDVTTVLGLPPDFVVLRQGPDPMAAVLGAVKTWPGTLRGLPIVATDIANVDDLEVALGGGISMVCGALSPSRAGSESASGVTVRPEVRRVGSLLHQLVAGAETPEIVAQIKGDVGLSYELLRRINSASMAHLHAGGSIDTAVQMMGRNELYRWLSVLLLQFGTHRKAASALHEVALWRSRLFELLATEAREPAPGQLFTLGLSSMLAQILGITVADVVAALRLPEPAVQALQGQSGPWARYLELAQALEAHLLDDRAALAVDFGGVSRVAGLSNEAWEWAASHVRADSGAA